MIGSKNPRSLSIALTMMVLALGGCGSFGLGRSNEEKVEPNVLPANYRRELLTFLQTHLDDPTGVRDAYVSAPELKPVGRDTRYIVCVRYNAKDSNGQYRGNREKIAIYFAGTLNQFVDATAQQCGDAVYQPFPELQTLKRLGQ